MLTHSYYEEDPRVRREAESLVAAGRAVDVFALRREEDSAEGTVNGVHVRRLDVQRHQGASLPVYLAEYVEFVLRAALALVRAHRRRRYALVQVHTLPDFLAFAALPLRLAGVPVLLDLHEAMPEFFRSRFPRAANPIVHRLLLLQERLSIAVSTHAITVNDALGRRLTDLGVAPDKVSVVINSPSLARFDPVRVPRRGFAEDGTVRLIYAGALTPTYELDVAIDAVGRLRTARPDVPIVFDVYGRGDSEPGLRARAAALGLNGGVVFHGRIPIDDVPAAIARADIGLAPTRRDQFTDVSLSTKIFEYGAMDKPAVASRLPLVEKTFEPGTVATYEPGSAIALAAAIGALIDDAGSRTAAAVATRERVREMSWEREAERYVALVDRLAAG
ncbi:MAG TPA: glycosyltransferase family 4 protein [Candidatus Limnocylindrales bacterium]